MTVFGSFGGEPSVVSWGDDWCRSGIASARLSCEGGFLDSRIIQAIDSCKKPPRGVFYEKHHQLEGGLGRRCPGLCYDSCGSPKETIGQSGLWPNQA